MKVSTATLMLALLFSALVGTLPFGTVQAATMWSQIYGTPAIEYAYSLVATSDGGYAITGVTEFGNSSGDFWLVKIDALGNMEWNQTYGGTGYDSGSSVANTTDGGYIILGTTDSFGAGGKDLWLVKANEHGNMQWNMTYGSAGDDGATSLVETTDGGYAMAGAWNYSIGPLTSFSDAWLIKTNASGDVEWNQTYGGTNITGLTSLVETADDGYAMAGYTYSTSGGWDLWLAKTDALGDMEWNQTYGGTGQDSAESLVVTSDGGYALAGYTGSFGAGAWDFWLVKTDAAGNMEWNQTYGGTTDDGAYSLVKTSDGGYALAGFTGSFGAGGYDFWLVKTDAAGNMEWNQTYGGEDWEKALSLVATSDGGYALAGGTYYWDGFNNPDFLLIKTDEYGDAPVIPEASWVILPLLLATTLAIFISKKKLLHPRS
jgi:predicted secreted protein